MRSLSILFIAFLFSQLTTFAQWTQKADIPTARCMATSCTLDSLIYVIGGTESTSSTGPSVGIMEVYDPILDSWDTTKADMPTSRVEFGACAVNGKIYAIGGADNHGVSPFGMVEEYDPSTNTWYNNNTPMPTPRKGAAYGVIDNKIYVAGGTEVAGFTASNKLEIYDPVTDTWVDTLETMLYAIYSPTGAVINDKFYVIGGLLGTPPWTGQKIVQMYDPIIDDWFHVADLDSGRVGHTTNGVAANIYAICGDRQPPMIRSVEEYDPNSNTWTPIDSAPFVKTGNTASVFENKIYLISGSTTSLLSGFTPTSTVYCFDPQDTIHIPTDYATIQEGIDAANNGDIVLVADGTYLENINYKGKAITVASHFLIDGNGSHIENTIIDGSQPIYSDSASVVSFISGEDTASVLCGFTITGGTGNFYTTASYDVRTGGGITVFESGAKICNNIVEYNTVNFTYAYGGGILVHSPGGDIVIIKNNIIRNNSVEGTYPFGGGISLFNNGIAFILSNKIIDNEATGTIACGGGIDIEYPNDEIVINSNYIKGNDTQLNGYGGGGINFYQWEALITVSNNLIVDNIGNKGGGILVDVDAASSSKTANLNIGNFSRTRKESTSSKLLQDIPILVNNTIIYNSATLGGGIYCWDFSPDVMNSIVWGNTQTSGDQIGGTVTATVAYSDVEGGYAGTNNIDLYPEFMDTTNGDYHLSDISPCIQTAIDSIDIAGIWYYCPPFDIEGYPRPYPVGTDPDMGAYEYQFLVGIEENETVHPTEYALYQSYPNPFNPTTTIKYGITERTFVELRVYDILGREVASLINEEQDAGFHKVNYNATKLASGIYLYQLKAGSFVETKKMLLLK